MSTPEQKHLPINDSDSVDYSPVENIEQSQSGSTNLTKRDVQQKNNDSSQIKAPPFSREKPALWFAQVEAQFRRRGISAEIDRFDATVPLIDTGSAGEVESLIINPPLFDPYTTLKETLITRFSKSKEAKLIQLLDQESLGDRTPSQHLRHLRALVPNIDEDVLKGRWLSHLSLQIQACLKTHKCATLDELSEFADGIHEVYRTHR